MESGRLPRERERLQCAHLMIEAAKLFDQVVNGFFEDGKLVQPKELGQPRTALGVG